MIRWFCRCVFGGGGETMQKCIYVLRNISMCDNIDFSTRVYRCVHIHSMPTQQTDKPNNLVTSRMKLYQIRTCNITINLLYGSRI
jgi:hypothetical protein